MHLSLFLPRVGEGVEKARIPWASPKSSDVLVAFLYFDICHLFWIFIMGVTESDVC